MENSLGKENSVNGPDGYGNTQGAQIIKHTIKIILNSILPFV